jgi:hypothetical protein
MMQVTDFFRGAEFSNDPSLRCGGSESTFAVCAVWRPTGHARSLMFNEHIGGGSVILLRIENTGLDHLRRSIDFIQRSFCQKALFRSSSEILHKGLANGA